MNLNSKNQFKEKLLAGQKVITAEITPPHGPSLDHFLTIARTFKGHFDAVNITDNQRALMRMSNLATATFLKKEGVEPIYQLTCRDRNSLALQSDLLGAQALGIQNVLCLTGDPVRAGHFVEAKGVFERESVGLLRIIAQLKQGEDSAHKKMNGALNMFVGAVVNPTGAGVGAQIKRMEKKLEAGAQFFQTQVVFDAKDFELFAGQVLQYKIPVVAGVLVVQTLKTAKFLNEKVPGIKVPDEFMRMMESSADPAKTGREYAITLSKNLLQMCQGVHLMTVRNEEVLIDVLKGIKNV